MRYRIFNRNDWVFLFLGLLWLGARRGKSKIKNQKSKIKNKKIGAVGESGSVRVEGKRNKIKNQKSKIKNTN